MNPILFKRYAEFARLDPGGYTSADGGDDTQAGDHILQVETIPAGAHLKLIPYDIILMGTTEVDWQQYQDIRLTAWLLPMHGGEAAMTINSYSSAKTLFDRYVPKISSVELDADWIIRGSDDSINADAIIEAIGSENTDLYWRPDRFSEENLGDPSRPNRIFDRTDRLGWMEQAAFRPGAAGKVVYAKRYRGGINKNIMTAHDSYIIWVLTLPPEVNRVSGTIDSGGSDTAETQWTEADLFPATRNFRELDFLSPRVDPIFFDRASMYSDHDDYRRAALHWYLHGATQDGAPTHMTVHANAVPLQVRAKWQYLYVPRIRNQGTVSPDMKKG